MSLFLDQWHQRYLQQARWTHELRKYIFQQCNLLHASRVLDVGCGTGVLETELLVLTKAITYGVDIDFLSLAFARQTAPDTIYIGGNGLSLPFPSTVFDVSLCHFLLLWVVKAQAVVDEMVRVTKPGGYVLALAEPDYGGRIDFPEELAQMGVWQNQALKSHGANPIIGRQIRSLFANSGLIDIEAGILGAQWRKEAAPEEAELEWQVLASDLEKNFEFLGQADILKSFELTTRKAQERVLFVPVFYAIGRVKG